MQSVARQRQSMRLLGRSYMAFVLAPEEPCADWLGELDKRLNESAGFFAGRPVVLDLAAVALSTSGIAHLIDELRVRGIRVLGIENAGSCELGPDLPPALSGGRPTRADPDTVDPGARGKASAAARVRKDPGTLLLDSPVRSGQSIFYPDGDVTVLGSVASGAELMAGGSIHVYGTLRGRALAGSNGNPRARIFCSRMQAELLAIDGFYLTADAIDPALTGRPVQAWLEGQKILISELQ